VQPAEAARCCWDEWPVRGGTKAEADGQGRRDPTDQRPPNTVRSDDKNPCGWGLLLLPAVKQNPCSWGLLLQPAVKQEPLRLGTALSASTSLAQQQTEEDPGSF